ncbi:MAG TPA: NBR1-Ig-like domain-containing protein [Anaerolineales bacterium]|nr:NBR1-Ig-like domain-containing protein [Anaerolineales bacterium]
MQKMYKLLIATILISLTLTACGGNNPEATPTQSVEEIQTAAVSTFAAGLTQTALFAPTATLTSTPIPTDTLIPTITTLATTASSGTVNSCNKLVYVQDVTIPDNTVMTPGQAFTKTWRVQNTGSCPWTVGYKFVLIGGDALGGQTLSLAQTINPGSQYEISIPMTAPTDKTGTLTGTWRMTDTTGAYFGDALTVVIAIGGTSTGSPTATTSASASSTPNPTATSSATPTPTP